MMTPSKKIKILSWISAFLWSVGCSNIFTSVSKKDTPEAIYEDMIKKIDKGAYSEALEKFNALPADWQITSDNLEIKSGIYAGLCGFDFVNYSTKLSNATGSTFFLKMMRSWTGVSTTSSYCSLSQKAMQSIGGLASQRTSSQNFFLAYVSLATIGSYLRAKADQDGTNFLGDGDADASFDACNSTPDTTSLTDLDIANIIASLALVIENISTVAAELSGTTSTVITDVQSTMCSLTPNPCSYFTPEAVLADSQSAVLIKSVRTIINTQANGIRNGSICL